MQSFEDALTDVISEDFYKYILEDLLNQLTLGETMEKNGYYYVAHPYSVFANKESGQENRKELERQFILACDAAGWLMDPEQGFVVISPISHCHPIAEQHELPRNWAYWKRIDRTYIESSIGMIIVTNPGWRESEGVTEEIQIAKELGKPVYYLHNIDSTRYILTNEPMDIYDTTKD